VKRSRRETHKEAGPFPARARRGRAWSRMTATAIAVTAAAIILPSDLGSAATQAPPPSLQQLVAQARDLSNQINTLSDQYDGLRIQLAQARAVARTATTTAARDQAALSTEDAQVGRLAAQGYMNSSVDPILQLMTSTDPQMLVSRAAIMQQLELENGAEVRALATAENTAVRAKETAEQQASVVTGLVKEMQGKTAAIQGKIDVLNGAAYKQAMAIFSQTGQYPMINIPGGNTVGVEALRAALTRIGDPYVWGAAGPDAFDCSGLVVWAYEQVGIQLEHYTGDLWDEGEHISRDQLEPGDLVFFYADISHVGIYVGDGMMVDAPTFGQPVEIQPVDEDPLVGVGEVP
jgi:peptidoglycan DL-endopeptidase CwlO